jgi:Allene oxide cyclase
LPHSKPARRAFALAVTAALSAGAVVAATSSASATRAHSASRAAHAASVTVHVIEHANTDTEIPTGGGKDVKGNILTFNNPVFNTANTKQVGHDEGFCTRIAPKEGIWECLWTTFLARGQITVQGPYYDTRNSVLSITGGTGAYRNARGQMPLLSRNNGAEYDFIFQLS